ncbi:MAG: T9SS type A sorting domain-containing protein [Bacteroidetes bacterium]|nr:T9SS type A sorting domain-containing protein [Bacteroidota bacterium]
MSINNALTFGASHQLRPGGGEVDFAGFMRTGVVETEATPNGSYSILMSTGPYSIESEESISPFLVAFVVGDNLDDLRSAVNLAYQRSTAIPTAIPTALDEMASLPDAFRLFQNYPNPFNSTTTINYWLKTGSKVKLVVYDISGREIKMLVNQNLPAGNHYINFDASDLLSGIYFYKLIADTFEQSRKMILLR